ncbi:MAG: PD-(D/E)XK nuclease family protein [Candidatus Marinimicrobia bacterium]|jgi:CRISPR/Cas system-associated exonuclease Cas4 (RecB family)|nr:PD-(D/E)XK nuclease family protein [Candidatus Neomarinimicrobiota bacterium]MBT3633619.1 PD-(D/E)XK nuclease family protein [Candidatus Neomarinimicrobiota bacterium]MBT3682428.1 PD-(D/E)XK nuclease family protein [Candidatus Neomarinimicrobiota bacterium]MBT3759192.1 PD-(D/E)XK nuclease family protein [Candidatus Neomarinimicrobiota bacterium]MBT3895535.1 PD-(D/E)XK nuclease family protein [Candidatus Neomarinimicrobiota bacterium]
MGFKPKNHYSFSQISTFKSCREQYKLVYFEGIRKKSESIEAFMGKCVHATLEWLYQKENIAKPYLTFDSICTKYDDIWVGSWHKDIFIADVRMGSDNYYSIGKRCLSNYYHKYGPTFDEYVVGTELALDFRMDGKYHFRGVIDRLDRPKPGRYVIHDYKTGKHPLTVNSAKNNLQLVIYHLCVQEKFDDVKDITLTWHFLRQGVEVSIHHSADEMIKFKKKLKKQVDQIVDLTSDSGNFYPKESILCNWCYYWQECSAKTTGNPVRRAE